MPTMTTSPAAPAAAGPSSGRPSATPAMPAASERTPVSRSHPGSGRVPARVTPKCGMKVPMATVAAPASARWVATQP